MWCGKNESELKTVLCWGLQRSLPFGMRRMKVEFRKARNLPFCLGNNWSLAVIAEETFRRQSRLD